MLHLIKLAVGARTQADVAAWQRSRTAPGEPVTVSTRQFPKRAAELMDGGSLFWVVAGLTTIRQSVVDVREIRREDGTRGTAILVDPVLVPLVPRTVRAFQGWRYLRQVDAPADLLGGEGDGMPGELRRALAELCLL
jgi:hypothetical protein